MPGRPPPERQCAGTSKQSGERCERWTTPGRDVCPSHGSKTPRGVAHHNFRHGHFSASIPARLANSYEEVLSDPRRLELNDELAVIIARNRELLRSLYSGESDGLWTRLRKLKRELDAARRNAQAAQDQGNIKSQTRYTSQAADIINSLLRLIERGASDVERWQELMANFENQRKLSESERKRRVEEHQIATTEEIMALMGAILAVITRHVKDDRIRRAIGTDLDAIANGKAPMDRLSEN